MSHRRRVGHPKVRWEPALIIIAISITAVNVAVVRFDLTAALFGGTQPVSTNNFNTAFWDTLNPVADSFVKENNPNQNRGTLKTLRVRSNSTPANFRTFAEFDLSSILPGNEVLKAEMTLCASAVPGAARTYDVYSVTAGWAETGITWNNQPGVATSPSSNATTPPTPECMTWPVTSDAQGWVVGAANHGLRVNDSIESSPTNYDSTFRSREYTVVPADQPSLFLVFRPCQDVTAPVSPSNLSASAGDSQVGLNWNDSTELDLAGYSIYRGTTQGGPYSKVNTALVVTSNYTDTGLTNGTTYYYVVTAVDNCANESGNSNEASATPAAVPPAAPTNLVATAGNTQVALDWDDNGEPDLAGYNVYRSTTQGGPYAQINGALVVASNYTDTGLTNGVTYYYVVTAENTAGQESGNSSEASATPADVPPAAPTGLAATSQNAQATLDWNDNAEPDLAGYNVYRSTTQGGPYAQINGALVAVSNYTDTGLTNGVTYYYVVTAEDNGGNESANSNEVSATPNALPPAPP